MPLKVLSSIATRAAYLELVPAFEQHRGLRVETQWAGNADIRKRLLAGEAPDVVIGAAAMLDELARGAGLDRGTRIDIARSGVGAAVRKGARRPDIASIDALKQTLRAANSIVYSSGPSGVYLAELFGRLGLAEEMKHKARQLPPGMLVAELVARGEAELCFQQLPELRQVAGIDYVGPLPAEVQLVTVFGGAVHAASAQREAGTALLRFLASGDAAAVMRKHGLEPA